MTEYEPNFLASVVSFAFLGIILSSILIWAQKKHRNPATGQNPSTLASVEYSMDRFSSLHLFWISLGLISPKPVGSMDARAS